MNPFLSTLLSLPFYLSFCMHALHCPPDSPSYRIPCLPPTFFPPPPPTHSCRAQLHSKSPQPACITFLTCFTISTSHTLLPLQHHVAQQCMRHIAHLFKISSSFVYSSYITLPTSPNTFSSYPIALNFPSATSASAAPRPCHRPGFQPPPSTCPTSFPTHTDKGI